MYPGALVRNECLVPDFKRKMEAIVSKIAPGTRSPVYEHEGEDFGDMLRGRLQFWVGEEPFTLEEGDSISFPARLPHYWIHPATAEPVETLWVITPPTR
ncbi:MAG: cupin domain-containing protein [Candidatus Rokubacteria bacterium]|nr:cupin domain-containing protein [Candidatus Rokubacteria bacterium]